MNTRRKILMGVLAIALPIGTIAAVQTTAFTAKVTGAGTTTCTFAGTINFNPPLTSAGTAGVKKTITTVNATLSACTGGTPVGPASVVTVKPIKTKTAKGANGATCAGFTGNAAATVIKTKVNWSG